MDFGNDDAKDAARAQSAQLAKENEQLKKQEASKQKQQQQIDKERIAALRGRLGGGFGGAAGDDSSSLFNQITGK